MRVKRNLESGRKMGETGRERNRKWKSEADVTAAEQELVCNILFVNNSLLISLLPYASVPTWCNV